MEEWSDSVKIAMDIIIACALISALLVCVQLGHKMMNVVDMDRAAAKTVQEYRIEAAYANTDVHPQDVTNLIIENQGYPAVEVHMYNGTVLTWDKATYATQLTSAAISSAIGYERDFHCTLEYAVISYDVSGHPIYGGELVKYVFTQHGP